MTDEMLLELSAAVAHELFCGTPVVEALAVLAAFAARETEPTREELQRAIAEAA